MGIPETQLHHWAGAGAVRAAHRSVPESQLQTWANPGAIAAAQVAHASIRAAINGTTWNPGISYEIFLQGSYKNDTNIWADSDVDVVVQFNSTYYYDFSRAETVAIGAAFAGLSKIRWTWAISVAAFGSGARRCEP